MFGLTASELFWASVMGACVVVPCGYIVLNKLDFMTGYHNETWNPLKWFQIPYWMKRKKKSAILEYAEEIDKTLSSLDRLKRSATIALESPSKIPGYKPAELRISELTNKQYEFYLRNGFLQGSLNTGELRNVTTILPDGGLMVDVEINKSQEEIDLEKQIELAVKEAEEKRLLKEKEIKQQEEDELRRLKIVESEKFFSGSEPFGDAVEQEWFIDGLKAFIDSKNRVFVHDKQWINKTKYYATEELWCEYEYITFGSCGVFDSIAQISIGNSVKILSIEEYQSAISQFCVDQKIHLFNLDEIERRKETILMAKGDLEKRRKARESQDIWLNFKKAMK